MGQVGGFEFFLFVQLGFSVKYEWANQVSEKVEKRQRTFLREDNETVIQESDGIEWQRSATQYHSPTEDPLTTLT